MAELVTPKLGNSNQEQKPNQPFIINLRTLEKLFFQTIPLSIVYTPDTNWVAVMALSQNNPKYQYTGAEDILEFSITWYSNEASRRDVITKCKWLESLSKNDGDTSEPPLLQFHFGDLFSDAKWVMKKAPYTLSNFDRVFNMLPTLANQSITLLRVTDENRSSANILTYNT